MKTYGVKISEGNRVFVTIPIFTKNMKGEKDVTFKLDTGADFSTISIKDLEILGYGENDVKASAYPTGHGSVATRDVSEHYTIDLRVKHIFGQIIPKGLEVPFVCISRKRIAAPYKLSYCQTCRLVGIKDSGFRSLLGNDILSCFNIHIDRANNYVSFERVKDLQERNRMYPKCEMHSLEQSDSNVDEISRSDLFG